jgi:radical SAM superfamily enzyme YgiQ (UPF0313 family)
MIVKNDPSKLIVGNKKALLINPPIYDTQYWAYWSQPHGLLKVATWLRRHHGYSHLRLLDCLATDARRRVKFHRRPGDQAVVRRGNVERQMWEYGWPREKLRQELERHARGDFFRPEEVWITSIMTYWWESTRDVVRLVQEVFDHPRPRIYVGGIYPTLDPEHANINLGDTEEIIVVAGEICDEAANSWTDLSLYQDEVYEARPYYAIITGSRGCPFNCSYCAQLKLNDGNRRLRHRDPEDIAEELAQKQRNFGIREVAFYEDNLLFNRDDFLARLEAIERRGLKFEIYAPEGIEPRLIEKELLSRMKSAGFEKIHLALETIDDNISRKWNRRQATIEKFDRAVDIAQECGFRVGSQDLNAFVLFGLPGESFQAVVNTALYASHRVGSVVPMLFTPVPGSMMFETHREYLLGEMGWDLQDLNGKLLPFLEYNQRHYAGLQASDYLELEAFMMRLNSSKVYRKRFDFAGDSPVARTFRQVVGNRDFAPGASPVT